MKLKFVSELIEMHHFGFSRRLEGWKITMIVQASCSKKDFRQEVYHRIFSGSYKGPKLLYNRALA